MLLHRSFSSKNKLSPGWGLSRSRGGPYIPGGTGAGHPDGLSRWTQRRYRPSCPNSLLSFRRFRADAPAVHFSQLVHGVGVGLIFVFRRCEEQFQGTFLVPLHSLPPEVEGSQGVGGEGVVVVLDGTLIPEGGFQVVLLHTVAHGVHLAHPVLEVGGFLFCGSCLLKTRQCFLKPPLGLVPVRLTPHAFQQEHAQIVGGQGILVCQFLHEPHGKGQVGWGCLAAVHGAPGLQVFLRPEGLFLPTAAKKYRGTLNRLVVLAWGRFADTWFYFILRRGKAAREEARWPPAPRRCGWA